MSMNNLDAWVTCPCQNRNNQHRLNMSRSYPIEEHKTMEIYSVDDAKEIMRVLRKYIKESKDEN